MSMGLCPTRGSRAWEPRYKVSKGICSSWGKYMYKVQFPNDSPGNFLFINAGCSP